MIDFQKSSLFLGSLAAAGCEILFGLSYVFTKQAASESGVSALLGWRFFVAIAVMSLFIAFRIVKVDFRNKSLKAILAVALWNPCIYFAMETVGIRYSSASESGVMLACIPIVSLAASALFLGRAPTARQTAGILVTLIGVVITVLVSSASALFSVKGYLALAAAVVSYALYSVSVEKADNFTAFEITYIMLIAGGLLFIPSACVDAAIHGSFDELMLLPLSSMHFLSAVLYQGVGCSVFAFFLSNAAISRIGVNRASSFIGLSTVVSILAGILILEESFSVYQCIGAAVIVIGIYIANMQMK